MGLSNNARKFSAPGLLLRQRITSSCAGVAHEHFPLYIPRRREEYFTVATALLRSSERVRTLHFAHRRRRSLSVSCPASGNVRCKGPDEPAQRIRFSSYSPFHKASLTKGSVRVRAPGLLPSDGLPLQRERFIQLELFLPQRNQIPWHPMRPFPHRERFVPVSGQAGGTRASARDLPERACAWNCTE